VVDFGALLATAASVVAVAGAAAGIGAKFFKRHKGNSKNALLQGLEDVRKDQYELTQIAWDLTPEQWKRREWFKLLTWNESWIPDAPFDIGDLELKWHNGSSSTKEIASAKKDASELLKPLELGSQTRYSTALKDLRGLDGLFDGMIYRPICISFGQQKLIDFQRASYFEYLDTSEVLALEVEVRQSSADKALRGAYRKKLRDPFNLQNRVCSLGINTLTLRLAADGTASFFLHMRDRERVANNSGLIALAPAGEFTPCDITIEAMTKDFDIQRNVVREYVEEFLCRPEARGQSGTRIDVSRKAPYSDIWQGMQDGSIVLKGLGVGLDPLTWKPELLTVCIFQEAIFDRVFASMVENNDEGTLIVGEKNVGLPFTKDVVDGYKAAPKASPTATAALHLCWRHRRSLGIMRP
jgi:hypothetical protein